MARVYGAVVARRNAAFDAGKGVVEIDRPVISVGNLSVGGTGKTPMVAHLVEVLRAAGRRPAIAMRGYGARRGEESDEARLYRDRFSEVPVVARPDRLEGLIELFATEAGEAVNVVVLDDGFQHRRLARTLDIVLVDATGELERGGLLPAGWLREPPESLRRAGAVVLTHAGRVSAERLREAERGVTRAAGRAPVAACSHVWSGLDVLERGAWREEPAGWLRGKRASAACAIGRPESFLAEVARASGTAPVLTFVRRDHDPYDVPTIATLLEQTARSGAEVLVVTAKDWVKLRRVKAGAWPCAVAVPRLGLEFVYGREALEGLVVEAARELEGEEAAEGEDGQAGDDEVVQ